MVFIYASIGCVFHRCSYALDYSRVWFLSSMHDQKLWGVGVPAGFRGCFSLLLTINWYCLVLAFQKESHFLCHEAGEN